jgi:predicted rRNA methylase YqxC with S4 and FtsJ domains
MTRKDRRMRLDLAMLERGLAASRERARSLILSGKVLVEAGSWTRRAR